jgi:hypothetical protein
MNKTFDRLINPRSLIDFFGREVSLSSIVFKSALYFNTAFDKIDYIIGSAKR